MITDDSKVLILGSSGQIGQELLCQLKKFNCRITCVNRSLKSKSNNNYFDIQLDISDKCNKKLEEVIRDNDYIFHLAGDTSVMADPDKEIDYLEKWISPLHNILNLITNTNKVLIFASSVSVYGVNPQFPVNEHTVEDPLTSYDTAKTCCDNLIRYYRNYHDVNCTSLRFSNVYGPETSVGNDSRRVINKILNLIHKNKEISIVSDGEYKRNYIHVYDAASMLIQGADNISKTSPVLIACSKENYSFKEIIICLAKNYENVFNKKIEIKLGLEKKFITDTRSFDGQPSKIFQVGFKYKYTLDEGFKELVKSI